MSRAQKSNRTEQIEIERKYDVDEATHVPDLCGVGRIASCVPVDEVTLRAVYYDTAEQVLLANRITLRRREGGHDEGWHVKFPGDAGARREVHAPLGDEPDEPLPAALRRVVEVVLRGRPVRPVLTLDTSRAVTRLRDDAGSDLAELADDRVTAITPGSGASQSWREWEVELAPGVSLHEGEKLLDQVGARLVGAGAAPSPSKSKLARGLGDTLPPAPLLAAYRPDARSAAGFVLGALGRVVTDLKAADAGVRDGDAEAVHEFRMSIRRLRSILRVYRGVVDKQTSAAVCAALARVGRAAGSTRDLQVAADELALDLDAAPDGYVSQETVGRLRAGLTEASREAERDLERDLADASYFELLDRLDVLLAAEPTGPAADHKATKFASARLAKETERARRKTEVASAAYRATGDCDRALIHAARKAARRLRYAIEAQQNAGLPDAESPKVAHALHDALGAALDAGSAAERFVAAAYTARWAGEDTFGYGVLATLAAGRRSAALARLPLLAEKL